MTRHILFKSAVSLALYAACMVSAAPTCASAQPPSPQVDLAAPRMELDSQRDLQLSRSRLRATRGIRAGAALLTIGSVGTLASAIAFSRAFDGECPPGEIFCNNQWARGMGSMSGLAIGSSLVITGLVTLSIGVGSRNRLRRVQDVSVSATSNRLDLRLRF